MGLEGSGRGIFEGTGYECLWTRRRNLRNILVGIIVNLTVTGLVQSAHKNYQSFFISLYIYVSRIDSPCGREVSAPDQTGPVSHPASYTMDTGSFPGGKVAGG